jgi:hypothetical protein
VILNKKIIDRYTPMLDINRNILKEFPHGIVRLNSVVQNPFSGEKLHFTPFADSNR